MTRTRGKIFALAALALAGCTSRSSADDPARVLTLREIRDGARNGDDVGGLPLSNAVAFRGQPISQLSPPFSSAPVIQRPDFDGTPVLAGFAEGQPAAYVTTDIWYERDPVWVQPLYVPVTEYDEANPTAHKLDGGHSIFSVGPGSSFYSPYWRTEFFVVPEGTDPNSLKYISDVLNNNYELHDGPLRICSLIPGDMGMASVNDGPLSRPLNGDAVAAVRRGWGWWEGQQVTVLDFGPDRYTASDHDVVDETPIFHFAHPGADDPVDYGLPSVAGVGPAGSAASVGAAAGPTPKFGGLWRLYFVFLPPSAAVFIPPSLPDLRAKYLDAGLSVPDLGADVAADPRVPDYTLRVALDSHCFAGLDAGFPDSCTWLDSQHNIETYISQSAIQASEVTLTCPMVEYLGKPVAN